VLNVISRAINAALQKPAILNMLEDRLRGFEPERSTEPLHISAIVEGELEFCARAVVLHEANEIKYRDHYVNSARRVAFDHGNALKDMLAEKWLGDVAVGVWHCVVCQSKHVFSQRPAKPCKCGAELWRYGEEEFIDEESGAAGHIDLFLPINQKLVAVEVKTLDKDEFAMLKAPMAAHRARTCCYLTIIARSGREEVSRIDLSHARVLYVSKGYGKKNENTGTVLPFKEFVVERNDATSEPYLKKARLVKAYRDHLKVPDRICVLPSDKRAKVCRVCKQCFGGVT
jgi:hypothetical protein